MSPAVMAAKRASISSSGSRATAGDNTGRYGVDGHRGRPVQRDRGRPPHRAGGLEALDAVEEAVEYEAGLEAREMRPEAEVDPRAEAEVALRVALDVDALGVGEPARVVVA